MTTSCLIINMKPARPLMLAHLKIIWQFHQKVSRFFGPRYIEDDFFRAESSLIQSSCRSFIRVIVPYERGYETSPLRFMLRRSSLVECVSVLPGNGVYKT